MKDQEWKRGEQDSVGLQCEYGSVGNVRFLNPQQVTMYDSRGNPVYCTCGKPAGAGIMGKEEYVAFCGDCYHKYLSESHATFSYKEPVANRVHNQILNDSWVRNLMVEGEENGDTDWNCPEGVPPTDGEPVYLKMEVIYKAWHLPNYKLSPWILESAENTSGKILSWQKREDGRNYHEKEPGNEGVD